MTRKKRMARCVTALLLLALLGLPGATAHAAGPKEIVLLPQWKPQAQFAGYYVALHKGFYERRGIRLTILEGGADRTATAYLSEGKADVVTLWLSSALQLADQGVSVVNLGQIIQRSGLMLAARKESGIRTPADMDGKKIALWPADFRILPEAFFDKFDIRAREVITECPVALFLSGGVQVASLMWYNEFHTLVMSGVDPEEMTLIFFDEVGMNFPEDGIYMLRETWEKDPETARAFTAATLEGWRYAFAHPAEAVDIVVSKMEAAHVPANRVHQRWMLERIRDLSAADYGDEISGMLAPEDYRTVAEALISSGRIRTAPSYDSFFMKEALP